MALAKNLSFDFSSGLRSRGTEYFRTGRVRIEYGSPTEMRASVRGSHKYHVELRWEDQALFAYCDCPYSESQGPCKHLWAAVLAADAHGHLHAVPANLRIEPVYESFDADLDDEEDVDEFFSLRPSPSPRRPEAQPAVNRWKHQIAQIDQHQKNGITGPIEPWPARRQILYVIDVASSTTSGSLVIELLMRDRKANGQGFNAIKEIRLRRSHMATLSEPADREILSLLTGGKQYYGWSYVYDSEQIAVRYQLTHPLSGMIAPLACRTGRCFVKMPGVPDNLLQLRWDDGEPWQFKVALTPRPGGRWVVEGKLFRGAEEMDLTAPQLLTSGGLVLKEDTVARLSPDAPFDWIAHLRTSMPIEAPEAERDHLLATLLEHPTAPRLEVPEELSYAERPVVPKPQLRIRSSGGSHLSQQCLTANLFFDYDGHLLSGGTSSRGFYDVEQRQFIPRDAEAENASKGRLTELGLKLGSRSAIEPEPSWQIPPKKLPLVVRSLAEAGWYVEAEGKTFRRAASQKLSVSSGVDWFELHGEIDYGASFARMPEILQALKRGEQMVRLDDGTYGILPQDWLSRFGPLAALGSGAEDHIRFRRNQAGLLDALLAARPEIRFDETFARTREQLRQFEKIQPLEQPGGFAGQLRDYQREGLGWMLFLKSFGFGGCLADDMGVGKTAQVLALLEMRRESRRKKGSKDAPAGPSLVVVPRSLVFNWKQESERFTPKLRVLDHTGTSRSTDLFKEHDIVLTTYGTLRRDAALFQDIEFDYVILDEAQAIKNAATESAKAVRLLRAQYRLALSGTPVENHLGELWSLFEFLNPGMLGAASVFGMAGGAAHNPDEETRMMLARALRPFILRRTKQQVARELPPKSEQTIYCDMEPKQSKLYNELLAHYRSSLLGRVDQFGLKKSKIQVLEALLRLRQAACHPGLLDNKRASEPSAKLDVLLAQLAEVLEEGHKALVFSQFTSLLKIVRNRLDDLGYSYEYLDGATRDRQARVEKFQSDSNCKLFLISLKAGGLGLNLTAAEYVFLLDPWWNPAVEAQAVDRAHRIGQDRHVFAYRLIARGTVEEKVLELQNTKRELASAIITQANSLIRDLRREDLELLLS